MGAVRTSGKEYFYSIPGLAVPQYMVNEALSDNIERFIDWVADNSGFLGSWTATEVPVFIEKVELLYLLLCDIHARWLEMEAARILRLAEIERRDLCRKLMSDFVANLRTLAIDIQMAQNRSLERTYQQRNEIEWYKYAAGSLKVVSKLLESSDFEKALDFTVNIDDIKDNEDYIPLIESISAKDGQKAGMLIEHAIAAYNKKMDDAICAMSESTLLKRILIVDDTVETLTALRLMLKERYQVFAFSSGEQALQFVEKKQAPDAFILDIVMPEMDGFALARQIRSKSEFENTPLIFLTGDSKRETFLKSMKFNAKAFIVKPASRDVIISNLKNCLK